MTCSLSHFLADLAADRLTRLAEDLTAIAGLDLSSAPSHEQGRAAAGIAESRREAAGALERLAESLPPGNERDIATTQRNLVLDDRAMLHRGVRRDLPLWPAAWRAFADAP